MREGDFEAIGVEEEAVVGVEDDFRLFEFFVGEDAEEAAFGFDHGVGAIGAKDHWEWVSCACDFESVCLAVDEAIASGGEAYFAGLSFDHVVVEFCESFGGGEYAVATR